MLAGAFAVLLAPLTVGALADATSLTAALAVVPRAASRSRRSGSRSSLLDEVEAAGEDGVEAAGAPAADGVADERGGALAVAADDRRAGRRLAGVTVTRTRRRS